MCGWCYNIITNFTWTTLWMGTEFSVIHRGNLICTLPPKEEAPVHAQFTSELTQPIQQDAMHVICICNVQLAWSGSRVFHTYISHRMTCRYISFSLIACATDYCTVISLDKLANAQYLKIRLGDLRNVRK